ncbi:MAG: SMI1/KNR4 family protein [Verrucomicrobiales bacterium]
MSDWRPLITEFYKLDHADDPDSLELGQPATTDELDSLDKELGFNMPPEFRSFYGEFNGFGTKRDGETDWFFVPISAIPSLTAGIRYWFQETHPEIAKRYVAVVDWGNGDSSGYLFSETGEPLEGFFIFEHESYEFEADQDWRDFIVPVDSSIHDFLTE